MMAPLLHKSRDFCGNTNEQRQIFGWFKDEPQSAGRIIGAQNARLCALLGQVELFVHLQKPVFLLLTWEWVHGDGNAERVVPGHEAKDGRVDLVHVQRDAV